MHLIIQCGDKKFWEQNSGDKIAMKQVYKQLLLKLQEYLRDFKIANAVVHFDEASPHMHVVGVPVGRGFKRGLLNHKKSTSQKKLDELDGEIESSNIFLKALRQIKQFIQSYLPFAPLIEEFANYVERGVDIEAGNSFRGLLTALGELLNSFKEIIMDGLCWFPASKGEKYLHL